MSTPTRTYIVKPKSGVGAVRLVRTTHRSRALEFVAEDTLTVEVATQEDLEEHLPKGVVVEKPGVSGQQQLLTGTDTTPTT